MTKKEIIEKLTELEIEFDTKSKKEDLEKLIPVSEEPAAEEPTAEEPKTKTKDEPITHPIDGRKIGSKIAPLTIEKVEDREQNGRLYKQITTLDGQTFLLSESDLDKQLIKE